jgi:hypothetical protein
MPAVWRNVRQTLTAGVFAATMSVAGTAYCDDWNPLAFQMMFDSTADTQEMITYNPAFSGVTGEQFMPYNVLTSTHPNSFLNFFGEGVTSDDLDAWTPTGPGLFNFKGYKTGATALGGDAFHIWWDVNINVDPVVNVSLLMNNPTPVAQTFTLTIPLVTGPIGPSTLMNGSAAGTATDGNGDGGSLSAQFVPGYQAWIDAPANVVQSMIPVGTNIAIANNSTATVGPYGFGQFPGGPVAGPAVVSQIGLTLTFTLSAFDSAIVNGMFEVVQVPGPGALSILAIAGLVGVRRRRRA